MRRRELIGAAVAVLTVFALAAVLAGTGLITNVGKDLAAAFLGILAAWLWLGQLAYGSEGGGG